LIVIQPTPFPRPLIGSVRHSRTTSWEGLEAAALARPSVRRNEWPRSDASHKMDHEEGRRGEGRGGELKDALSNPPNAAERAGHGSPNIRALLAPADWER